MTARILMVLFVLLAILLAASLAQAAPSLTLNADKTSVAQGDTLTFAGSLNVPATDTARQNGVVCRWTPTTPLTAVSGVGPKLITSTVTITWTNPDNSAGTVTFANLAPVRVEGQTAPAPIVGGAFVIPLGDFRPGDSCLMTLVTKW